MRRIVISGLVAMFAFAPGATPTASAKGLQQVLWRSARLNKQLRDVYRQDPIAREGVYGQATAQSLRRTKIGLGIVKTVVAIEGGLLACLGPGLTTAPGAILLSGVPVLHRGQEMMARQERIAAISTALRRSKPFGRPTEIASELAAAVLADALTERVELKDTQRKQGAAAEVKLARRQGDLASRKQAISVLDERIGELAEKVKAGGIGALLISGGRQQLLKVKRGLARRALAKRETRDRRAAAIEKATQRNIQMRLATVNELLGFLSDAKAFPELSLEAGQ
ncbi:MAG: hypothetical protein H6707_21275 [Deltaproteobacteria bacterium]|nr:hypothetical protein [Deltaproteobacteria bacterium]